MGAFWNRNLPKISQSRAEICKKTHRFSGKNGNTSLFSISWKAAATGSGSMSVIPALCHATEYRAQQMSYETAIKLIHEPALHRGLRDLHGGVHEFKQLFLTIWASDCVRGRKIIVSFPCISESTHRDRASAWKSSKKA
ncbi:hypothetical protein [Acidithiobacillus ferriphilus]|uniref:hypothetical protein n=1 Tax=Acidithiobacillus ferriphilus TaxID=1689834 RepID=UPI002DBF32FB|nr:hypothetical protein [Acidithiobacillus ferriphilus]MEB8536955.1 hypothetical protein [Acidithiobacillus ferriphilus]